MLRVHEVRDAYRLIGDCRDLGHDPALWQVQLMEGICKLVGVPAACGGEGLYTGPARTMATLSIHAAGYDASALRAAQHWHRNVGSGGCSLLGALKNRGSGPLTFKRTELVSDKAWYRSPTYLHRADTGFDGQLTSVCPTARAHETYVLCLQAERRHRDFTNRQRELVHFLNAELAPLVGRALVSSTESVAEGLSPRLRQTLACLLEGDSEKQVATRLGLSVATVHQYVTALYRRFGVRSRAELLVHVLRRLRHGAKLDFPPLAASNYGPEVVTGSDGPSNSASRSSRSKARS